MAKARQPIERTGKPDELFARGAQFALAASHCSGHRPPLAFPAIVSSALALELFLKSLLVIEGKTFPSQHSLNILYGRLSADNQSEILKLWKQHTQSIEWKSLAQFMLAQGEAVDADLPSNLRQSAEAFVAFRYPDADRKLPPWFLGGFEKQVLNMMLEKFPAFRSKMPTYV